MFFEGAEKKAEIQIHSGKLSLLSVEEAVWQSLIDKCNAKILSSVRSDTCTAYLLSESSLFVWADRILLITCGETTLVNSVEFFVNHFGAELIKQVVYQRKNEYDSRAQPSGFNDDARLLNKILPGKAYRFGNLDTHYNFIYHYENEFIHDENDKTYELLAYQISEQASEYLSRTDLTADDIRGFLRLDELVPGFDIDDFVFEPFGYSMNAVKGSDYLTIHITPQFGSSYVSFEANIDLLERASIILDVLAPNSFDVLTYNEFEFVQKIKQHIPTEFVPMCKVAEKLSNGYLVKFVNYVRPSEEFSSPVPLTIAGDDHAF